ncbi:MAG: FGGY family carbohydrate kinase [Eubacteriales bacterium]|nr:FGGY family carbohydrate kinase [Eubacteriales bacterium]
MTKLLLGIDAGTTAFKASIFNTALNPVASVQRDYTLFTTTGSVVEFPAEEYYRVLCECIQALLNNTSVRTEDICALSLSCQGETLVCLDSDGQPLGNAIVWLDNRANDESDALRQRFGVKKIYETTGQSDMTAGWPAAKILWIRNHQPARFQKTARFLLLEDYLIYRLTGKFVGEKNLWASSAMIEIHKGQWWFEMLDALGVDENRLPSLSESAVPVGAITADATLATGLTTSTVVATGALDQTCNLIGCGITKPGSVCETTGSCLAVSAILDHPIPYDEHLPVTCQNHAVPGRYTLLSWSQSAGMTLKWLAKEFYKEASSLDEAYIRINQESCDIPIGSNGLVMLPHLSGSVFPEFDAHARGTFCGANLSHTRGHFAHAVMESIACMLRQHLNILNAVHYPYEQVYCMGGGANSPVWLQIKADITQKKMIPLHSGDSACRGAALLAGVAIGVYSSIDDVNTEKVNSIIYSPRATPQADFVFRRFEDLYTTLKPFFQKYTSQSEEVS